MTRVMIVDDKPDNLYYLDVLLRGHGFEVESARHGAEALAKARQTPPEVVVSDLLMPVMDGFTLLRHWKADERLRRIPFVVYTATYTEPQDERLAIDLGADGFILKPSEPDEFIRRLREVMKGITSEGPSAPREPAVADEALLRTYSETLIRKLEEKSLQLEETNRALRQDLDERQRNEAERRRLLHDLGERVKELRALHEVGRLLRDDHMPASDLLAQLVAVIPDAMQYPDVTGARVRYDGLERATPRYRESPWMLSCHFRVAGGVDGEVTVVYLEEMPPGDEGPFLREERHLVDTLGEMLRAHFVRRAAQEALRSSESRLRTIVDSEPECVKVVASDGRLLDMNPAGLRMIEADEVSQVLDRQVLDLIHPDDRAAFRDLHRRVLAGATGQLQFRIVGLQGTERWMDTHSAPLRDDDGEIRSVLSVTRDITVQREIATQLSVSDALLEIAGRTARLGGWTVELPSRRVIWNDQMRLIFDMPAGGTLSLDEGLARHLPGSRERIAAAFERCAAEGTAFDEEVQILTMNERRIWVRVIGEAARDGDGRIIRVQGAFQDISERKAADARMREQADLLDKAQDAIVVRDLEHRIRFWNRSAERLYGWPGDEVLGQHMHTLLYADPTAFEEAHAALLARGEWTGELHHRRKDGTEVTVEGRWTLVRDDEGRPASVLAINTDITERRRLEQQMIRAQRLESIGTLAGGIAHDLNNVLTPILMSIELLRDGLTDAADRETLDLIGQSAQRGADMVRQVLTFARGLEGRRITVHLRQVVRELRRIVDETFPKDIRCVQRLAPDLWLLEADPTQVHQVLLNLCVNARDAMPNGGTITITAENLLLDEAYTATNIEAQTGPHVRITVEDTGTGIPPEIAERIFDPFFTTKEVGKGTGLGLATSLAIAKGHGGFMRVYSEPGVGTRICVYLPAHQREAGDAVEGVEVHPPRGQGEVILVIDDEAAVREITRRTLVEAGYEVLLAADGAAGVSMFSQHRARIALVLTDMMMPVMDGAAAIRILRRAAPSLRIVAASGLATHRQELRAPGMDVHHFLPKPYTAPHLLRTVREALNEVVPPR